MAVTLDSANSDFHLGDIESQIVPQYISEAAAGKKKKKKKEEEERRHGVKKWKHKPSHCNVSSMFRRDCWMPDS